MKSTVVFIVICVTVAVIAAVCGARSQPQEAPGQAKWEYRIVSYAWLSGLQSLEDSRKKSRTLPELEAVNDDMAHRMTDLGKQGWELVCVHEDSGFIFKRNMP